MHDERKEESEMPLPALCPLSCIQITHSMVDSKNSWLACSRITEKNLFTVDKHYFKLCKRTAPRGVQCVAHIRRIRISEMQQCSGTLLCFKEGLFYPVNEEQTMLLMNLTCSTACSGFVFSVPTIFSTESIFKLTNNLGDAGKNRLLAFFMNFLIKFKICPFARVLESKVYYTIYTTPAAPTIVRIGDLPAPFFHLKPLDYRNLIGLML